MDVPVYVTLALSFIAAPANAHVNLADPNGGEVLEVGSVFAIRWHILIAHNLQNWDLWYSTTGSAGPACVPELPVACSQTSHGNGLATGVCRTENPGTARGDRSARRQRCTDPSAT